MLADKIDIQNNLPLRQIHVGKLYRHYSGKLYAVIAIAYDSENPQLLRVIYQGLYNDPVFGHNPIWSRLYDMFAENVIIDGKVVRRFEQVD